MHKRTLQSALYCYVIKKGALLLTSSGQREVSPQSAASHWKLFRIGIWESFTWSKQKKKWWETTRMISCLIYFLLYLWCWFFFLMCYFLWILNDVFINWKRWIMILLYFDPKPQLFWGLSFIGVSLFFLSLTHTYCKCGRFRLHVIIYCVAICLQIFYLLFCHDSLPPQPQLSRSCVASCLFRFPLLPVARGFGLCANRE